MQISHVIRTNVWSVTCIIKICDMTQHSYVVDMNWSVIPNVFSYTFACTYILLHVYVFCVYECTYDLGILVNCCHHQISLSLLVQRIGTFFCHETLMNAVRMYACAQRRGHRQVDQEGDNEKQRLGEREDPRRRKTSSAGQSAGLLIPRSSVRFRQKLKKQTTQIYMDLSYIDPQARVLNCFYE